MADFYSFIRADRKGSSHANRKALCAATDRQRAAGAAWARVTVVDERHRPLGEDGDPHGYWIEGWRERPEDEGPFDPPLEKLDTAWLRWGG